MTRAEYQGLIEALHSLSRAAAAEYKASESDRHRMLLTGKVQAVSEMMALVERLYQPKKTP